MANDSKWGAVGHKKKHKIVSHKEGLWDIISPTKKKSHKGRL